MTYGTVELGRPPTETFQQVKEIYIITVHCITAYILLPHKRISILLKPSSAPMWRADREGEDPRGTPIEDHTSGEREREKLGNE